MPLRNAYVIGGRAQRAGGAAAAPIAFAARRPGIIKSTLTLARFAVFVIALIWALAPAAAAPPAGSLILNQAEASWLDADANDGSRVSILSNQARVLVRAVLGVDITEGQTRTPDANGLVHFPHVVANTGNAVGSFILDVANLSDDDIDLTGLTIYLDVNRNGAIDTGETPIEGPLVLDAGDDRAIVVAGAARQGLDGDIGRIRVSAQAESDAAVRDEAVDVVVRAASGPRLTKRADRSCDARVFSGERIRYDVRGVGLSSLIADGAGAVVDGVSRSGALVFDEIPANTTLRPDGDPAAEGGTLVALVDERGDLVLREWRNDISPEAVLALGVLMEPGDNAAGAMRLQFSVTVNPGVTAGTMARNRARIDPADGSDPLESNEVCTPITSSGADGGETRPTISFLRLRVNDGGGGGGGGASRAEAPAATPMFAAAPAPAATAPAAKAPNVPAAAVPAAAAAAPAATTPATPAPAALVAPTALAGPAAARVPLSARAPVALTASAVASALKPTFVDHITEGERHALINETQTAGVQVDFTNDALFEPAYVYHADSYPDYDVARHGAWLEVRSTSLNRSAFFVDEVTSGHYIDVRVDNIANGDHVLVRVTETSRNSGVFRSRVPLRFSESARGVGEECAVHTPEACVLHVTDDTPLRASIFDPGAGEVIVDAAVVDPTGVVFDSKTNEPVSGALVSVRSADGALAIDPDANGGDHTLAPQRTGADGRYHYPRLFPGSYYIQIDETPVGYAAPSKLAPNAAPSGRRVGAYSYGRNGFDGTPNSGIFTLSAGDPVLVVDIPIDPPGDSVVTGPLVVEKRVLEPVLSIGDFAAYEIRVRNMTGGTLRDVRIEDATPFGFKPAGRKPRRDGEPISGVAFDGQRMVLPIGELAPDAETTLSYVLLITPGAVDGDGVNAAIARGVDPSGREVASNVSRARVEMRREGVLSDRAIVFGRVAVRPKCENLAGLGDWPVPGARIYMEDGTYVVTDENGQFSLYGITPRMHVMRLDPVTLPDGLTPIATDTRHALNGWSRFVDPTNGEFHRADFILDLDCDKADAVWSALEIKSEAGDLVDDLERALSHRGLIDRDRPADRAPVDGSVVGADGDVSNGLLDGGAGRRDQTDAIRARAEESSFATTTPAAETDSFPDLMAAAHAATAEQASDGVFLWPRDENARDGRFLAVIRDGVDPTMYVNGTPVRIDQLGDQLANASQGAQVVAWYGVELAPGENNIEIKGRDPFGNERVLATKTFVHAGPAARVRIETASDTLPADIGASQLEVRVRLEDKDGRLASGVWFVTLEASDGRWVEPDVQASEPGRQVKITTGEGVFHLKSSERTGVVTLRASVGADFEATKKVRFVTPTRPLIAVGLIDITGHFNHLKDFGVTPPAQADGLDETYDVQGRAALFLKGKIKGDLLLTLAYDSSKSDDTELLRDIDPEAYYPVYGDSSARGYEAQSRSQLYVKIERDRSSVMWGDYQTDANNDQDLAKVSRTLTGANVHIEEGDVTLDAWGARPDEQRIEEAFRGNGTAANYRLKVRPIRPNSETIEIIIRDRDNPGLVIETRTLSRFGDYVIDYRNGFVTFHETIPSLDEEGRAVFIRAQYDAMEDGESYTIAGARAQYKPTEWATIGAAYTYDGHPDDGFNLAGGFVKVELDDKHEGRFDVAWYGGRGVDAKSARAGRLEWRSKWTPDFSTAIAAGYAERGFDAPSASVAAGREELRAETEYRTGLGVTLRAEVSHSRDLESDDLRQYAEAGVKSTIGDWQLGLAGRVTHETEDDESEIFPSAVFNIRRNFNIFGRTLAAGLEYEQHLTDIKRQRLAVISEYEVYDKVSVYARSELINRLSSRSGFDGGSGGDRLGEFNDALGSTVIGVKTGLIPSTESYAEYRVSGDVDGRAAETAFGVRGGYELWDGFRVDPSFEFVKGLDGDDTRDSIALSVGVSDTSRPADKRVARVETRITDQSRYFGGSVGWAKRVDLDWTAIARADVDYEIIDVGEDRLRATVTAGVARRPRIEDDWHMLGLYQFKIEKGVTPDVERQVHILSTHHSMKFFDRLTLSGRLAGKYQDVDLDGTMANSVTALADARAIFEISDRWDVDLRGGLLSVNLGESNRYSVGAGVAWTVRENLRVGVGYNLAGFKDNDLDAQGYNAGGVYFSLNYKFGEELFGWLE